MAQSVQISVEFLCGINCAVDHTKSATIQAKRDQHSPKLPIPHYPFSKSCYTVFPPNKSWQNMLLEHQMLTLIQVWLTEGPSIGANKRLKPKSKKRQQQRHR